MGYREELNNVAFSMGHIRYRTDLLLNPARQDGGEAIYSPALQLILTRRNVPQHQDVWVDGLRARIECENFDYGVYSRSILLQGTCGSTGTIYCKELHFYHFYTERQVQLPDAPLEPPRITALEEEKEILGYRCRRARVEEGAKTYDIYYTPEVRVAGVADAVLRHPLENGLVLEREEVPDKRLGIFLTRTTATRLKRTKPPATIFETPAGFERVPNVDFARIEDRRRLDAWSAEQWTRNPLTAHEKTMYLGVWQLDNGKDRVLVEIETSLPDGVPREDSGWSNRFVFKTTVLFADQNLAGAVSRARATMRGRMLLVEEPPNYSLYTLSEDGKKLRWRDNPTVTYSRTNVDKQEDTGKRNREQH
jgi:hypothetical protein